MKKNKELKEAGTKLRTMSRAEYRERMAWFREKAILDYNSGMSSAREQGIEQGERKAKIETAKKMLEKHIPISTISELTGLSHKEIEECKLLILWYYSQKTVMKNKIFKFYRVSS